MFRAQINFDRFESALYAVDAHTAGEFCRVIFGGFDEPQGSTMIEKKNWMEEHRDHLRGALMFEPRGHHDMFGAFICEPVHEEADLGILFMDTGGYLNMCGHCSIGTVTVALEAGFVASHEGKNTITLDAPAGLIRATAEIQQGKVTSVTIQNVPSFVYKKDQVCTVDGRKIPFTISFGGSFFALVDTTNLDIGNIDNKTVPEYTELGMRLLDRINKEIEVKHPNLNITTVDLVEFYGPTPNPSKANLRNIVIFGDAQADRSPCGTGTSAKLATLYHAGQIGIGEEFCYESFIGSTFKGSIKEVTKVGDYPAVVPLITGSSYLTGTATYLIDPTDPWKYGFNVAR